VNYSSDKLSDLSIVLVLVLLVGLVAFDGVEDTKNDKGKDKTSDNEGGDCHDYLFIPHMASEPLKESFHIRMYSLSGLLWNSQSSLASVTPPGAWPARFT
jgi:hypothetical protein